MPYADRPTEALLEELDWHRRAVTRRPAGYRTLLDDCFKQASEIAIKDIEDELETRQSRMEAAE